MTEVRWLAARLDELPGGEGWLTDAERAVLSHLRVPKRRGDWLLGRWAAKRALVLAGEAASERDVAILASSSGAPEAFVLGRPASLTLSLTHSRGVGVVALGAPGTRLGVDLEAIEERAPAFLGDWFTDAEQAYVGSGEPALAASLVWSAKEAVMKALREGLRIPPKAVDVRAGPAAADGTWRPLEATAPGAEPWSGWWRTEEGLVLSVVASPAAGAPIRIG